MTRLPALFVPVLFAFQSLVVGENCPAAVDVEARVRTILHLTPEQELSEGFAVERHEAGLYVELRSADSTVIGQRTLPAEGNCDELAQAAAVVLSAWLSDVHPDFAGALPPSAAPEPSPESPPTPAPPPAPTLPAPRATPPAARVAPVARAWDLALGIGADLAAGEPTLSGYFGVGYGARATGWGGTLMLAPALTRTKSLGPGSVHWRRWPVGVGPSWRLAQSSLDWDFSAGPALAWLRVSATGFQHNNPAQNGASWGGFLNVRVANRARPWGVFGLLDAQLYPLPAKVAATNVSPDYDLPLWGLSLAVGVRFSP